MSLKNALLAIVGRAPLRRWTEQEIASRRAYLEAALHAKQMTASDTVAVSEYLIQRYLPPDAPFTKAKWRRFKGHVLHKLAAAEKAGALTQEAAAARIAAANDARQARERTVRSSYMMSAGDFRAVVGGLLAAAKHPLSEPLLDRLFVASGPERVGSESTIEDGIHPGLVEVARAWRENYQLLRGARNAGYGWIRVSPNYRCGCRAGATHQVHRIEEILKAFEEREPGELVYPSPTLPCLQAETPFACSNLLHPADTAELHIDPKFEEWLQSIGRPRMRATSQEK